MLFILLFILTPLLEIYLFIKVGGAIGAVPTIFAVVLTAVVGVGMLRVQGLSTLARFRGAAARGELPAFELLEGVILLLGGALLLTPGFFTDGVGFLCLLRTSRMWMVHYIVRHAVFSGPGSGAGHGFRFVRGKRRGRRPDILEGEFRGRDLDD